MAFLRPITQQALTDVKYDIKSRDIHIEEKDRYSMAKKIFEEDKDILFIYYWDDADEMQGGGYTYPIENDDYLDYMIKKL